MSHFQIIAVALGACIDGFWVGLAMGLGGKRLNADRAFTLGLVSAPITIIALLMAQLSLAFISPSYAGILGGLLLIVAGLLALRESIVRHKKVRKADLTAITLASISQALFFGFVVSADASIAAFSIGLLGNIPLYTPLVFVLGHSLFSYLGNIAAIYGLGQKLANKISFAPALMLIVLGVTRMI